MQITNFTLNTKSLEEDTTTFMLYCTETVCSLLSSHIKVQKIPKRMIQQLRHIFQYLAGESLSSDHTQSPSSSSFEIFNAWKVWITRGNFSLFVLYEWERVAALAGFSPALHQQHCHLHSAQQQQGQQTCCCFKEEDTKRAKITINSSRF